MKKLSPVRIIICVLMVAFLLFSPAYLISVAKQDSYKEQIAIEPPKWQGKIVLYHVVTAKTYQGSVTYYLKTQAEAFEKKNRGVFIEVIGMDEQSYIERLSYGRRPDAISFFAGSVYLEQLMPLKNDYAGFKDGLKATEYAVPYFFCGYATCSISTAKTNGTVCTSYIQAARLGLIEANDDYNGFTNGNYKSAILDTKALGECHRNENIVEMEVKPVDNFTDQVCYLGMTHGTDDDKAYWIEQFFCWLLDDKAQTGLSALGAFSVRDDFDQTFSQENLNILYSAYQTVSTVDPFLFYSNRSALIADAQLCVQGDNNATVRFFDRLTVVLCD